MTKARTCILTLPHGKVYTPAFMPVGTNAGVKAIRNEEIEKLGINLILCNTYHLYLRPGIDVIKKIGGLHNFMSWKDNILTDSGGFQVFSLAPFRKIEKEGIYFRSHIDGSYHRLTAEKVINIQHILGSDIIMPLDICTPADCCKAEALNASNLTTSWAKKSYKEWEKTSVKQDSCLFGIIQGNFYYDIRKKSAEELQSINFPGYAIGGLSVGESKKKFIDTLSFTEDLIPENKPRYLMGVGTPEYLFDAIERGIDLFDCVFPTRIARNALAFTSMGTHSLRNESNKYDDRPIDPACDCSVCLRYSRSYIRHLFKSKEINAAILTTYHNIYFIHKLMLSIRNAISCDKFLNFKQDFLDKYSRTN